MKLWILLCIVIAANGDESHRYKEGEKVTLWANKVGPYRNPQETYEYYSYPFCKPEQLVDRAESLGEALSGYELVKSKIEIEFRTPISSRTLCEVSGLSKVEINKFMFAVENQYWFEFFLDELPIWGLVGDVTPKDDKTKEKDPFIYIHTSFLIKYNKDRVIEVSLTQDNPLPLRDAHLPFKWTYSVDWKETTEEFEHRFDRYLDNHFFEHQIHWFSIFNSFMMVLLLVGLVAIILMRTLKKDITKFSKDADDVEVELEESGWKQVHGEVFRAPANLDIFSAILGVGTQLLFMTLLVILCSVAFYHNHPFYRRGTIVTVFVTLFCFTGFIGGYVSGSYYLQNGGKNWKLALFYLVTIFPGGVMAVAFLLNFVALAYGSLAHIPVSTMIIVFILWLVVYLPISFGGTILGRHYPGKVSFPCRITPIPRSIPTKRFYQELWVHVLLGGVLPFGSIFIEMYFVFTAFWQYKYYYVFGFLLLVYLILLIVVSCVTIVSTYFLLNAEDYRWQWVSFLSGASTSLYVYIYAIYYFFHKTRMSGFFQVTFYFGYMAMFCFGLALLCGAVGFLGASFFVHRIYRMIHVD